MSLPIFLLLSFLAYSQCIEKDLNTNVTVESINHDFKAEPIRVPVDLLNATKTLANALFTQELNNTEQVPAISFPNKTTVDSANFNPIGRRIFQRQVVAQFSQPQQPSSLVGQSPFFVRSQSQLAAQSSEESRNIASMANIALRVSKSILTREQLNQRNFDFNPLGLLSNIQTPNDLCPFKARQFCDASKRYSSIDGSCNNLQSPWLGKSQTPYKRYMQPSYDDKINTPRTKSVDGSELPSPRVVSRALSDDNQLIDDQFTHVTAIFGQFLAHDVTAAAASSGKFSTKSPHLI
jgi:hypothetical protein